MCLSQLNVFLYQSEPGSALISPLFNKSDKNIRSNGLCFCEAVQKLYV